MVRMVGWRGLGISATEESRIRESIERNMHKILSLVDNLQDVSIRVKQASKAGNTHRYEVSVSVLADKHFHAQHTSWDLFQAVQRAFGGVVYQLQHKAHAREALYNRGAEFYPEPLLRM